MSNFPTKTICFFNSNRAWGGGEKWHFTTAKEFQRQGYRVLLATHVHSQLARRGIQDRLNVYTFFVGNLSFLNPIKLLVVAAFFKFKNVDAVILNLPSDLKLAGLAAKLAGVKTIIYRRGMPHPLRNTWLNRFLFQKVLTQVVVNSEEIGRSLQAGNEGWFPRNKMVLVYNGVNAGLPVDRVRKLVTKKTDEFIIGNIGRLTDQKGQKYLIEMAKILKENGLPFKVYIAGEGELRAQLTADIQAAKLEDEIILLGHVDDIPAFLNSLDVFVFPSLYEGLANTLVECLQHEVPCVAFNVSSNPEILQHGVTGYLARAFDVGELASYVTELLRSPEKAREMARNGVSLIEKKFDSRENLKILQRLL